MQMVSITISPSPSLISFQLILYLVNRERSKSASQNTVHYFHNHFFFVFCLFCFLFFYFVTSTVGDRNIKKIRTVQEHQYNVKQLTVPKKMVTCTFKPQFFTNSKHGVLKRSSL